MDEIKEVPIPKTREMTDRFLEKTRPETIFSTPVPSLAIIDGLASVKL